MTDARAIAVATLAKYGGRRWPDERGYPYTPAAEAICNLEAALRALLAELTCDCGKPRQAGPCSGSCDNDE